MLGGGGEDSFPDRQVPAWFQGLRRSPGQGGDDRGFSTKGVIAGHDHHNTDSTISCCGVPAVKFRAAAAS
jgi:hypothetical protein